MLLLIKESTNSLGYLSEISDLLIIINLSNSLFLCNDNNLSFRVALLPI